MGRADLPRKLRTVWMLRTRESRCIIPMKLATPPTPTRRLWRQLTKDHGKTRRRARRRNRRQLQSLLRIKTHCPPERRRNLWTKSKNQSRNKSLSRLRRQRKQRSPSSPTNLRHSQENQTGRKSRSSQSNARSLKSKTSLSQISLTRSSNRASLTNLSIHPLQMLQQKITI